MSSLGKSVILLVVILAIGGGLVAWKQKYGGPSHSEVSFNKMTKEEMELLLKDANPMMLKRLADDPEIKKQQLESIKQLLAIASEAKKNPEIYDANTQKAMEIIDAVIWARTYDQEINKDKGPMPPFGFITEDQIKEFYGEGDAVNAEQKAHAAEFEEFLNVQLNFARKNKSVPEDTEPSDEEKNQMKQEFAKIKIYETEAKAKVKSGELKEDFSKKVELQSKLQQAQFLSRMYSTEVLAKKAEVTPEDIDKYIAEHPELNTAETKKAKATEVLQRLKNGEDFAALAKEFSEDPGSKDKGGLYEGVTEGGGFDKSFESAALALQPGQFTQELVETPFGYHIIKLERKGEAKDQSGQVKQSYDVRHILFSTMVKDPENPMAREMPVKDFVKSKLEDEKQKKVLDELVANNNVEVAEDFEIPKVSDEQMQEMMKKQMQQQMPQQMPPGSQNGPVPVDPTKPSKDVKKTEPKKPEPKKK
ncbi:MAG TPA: peptidylprolyl isomerase [Pyrinomonadaceae bacterium]|nr:peptidylprolyl isomerase [Pyrinomonadaceae bacterium]